MAREIVTSENKAEYDKKKLGLNDNDKVHLEHENEIAHIFYNNKKVGQIEHQDKNNMIQILRSDVNKEHQKKGIGTKAYHQFIDHHLDKGKSVGSDSILTEAGQGVWENLKKKYDVKKADHVEMIYPGNLTTTTREWRSKNRPRTKIFDGNYASGHEPVYQIHPSKD